MPEPVISCRGLSKIYRVYARPWDRLRELLGRRPRHRSFPALSGISFDAVRGEGLGIIGENGAGKSTLLKILAGITAATAGEVKVVGKVASILELGSAFHPELTGRQNVVLNAALLGLERAEIDARLPDILAFSELGDFIDQPVKCYSTGMTMRLGFSIATQVDPEVLIIDEALSVGDGYFQKKCMDRLLAMVEKGTTLLFCSHAMYYVTAFCRRALWLRQGEIAALGPAAEVVREYENFLLAKNAPPAAAGTAPAVAEPPCPAEPAAAIATPPPPPAARLVAVHQPAGTRYHHRQPWTLEVEWESLDPTLEFHLGVGINRIDEVEVLAFSTHRDGRPPLTGRRHYHLRLTVPELPMVKGAFTLYVFLFDESGLHIHDRQILPGAFDVVADRYQLGLIQASHRWQLVAADPAQRAVPLVAAAGH